MTKICIAQTKSQKGNVTANIANHLLLIDGAIRFQADLIVFPELSITSYEPRLAKELATTITDTIFDPFQERSDQHGITIGIGMPTKSARGIHISMLIFQPNAEPSIYSKQMLHDDELPYFICGNTQTVVNIKGKKIALGICYETLQRDHFLNAKQQGADIYLASVAKPNRGLEKAYQVFPKTAKKFNTPILMANSVGFCDNFVAAGKSAAWDNNGVLLAQLDKENEGLIFFDAETQTAATDQSEIDLASMSDLDKIFQIYLNAKAELENQGIFQWTSQYPTKLILEKDLSQGVLYALRSEEEIIGAINISEQQEAEYASIPWLFKGGEVLVIHRLVVDPKHQRKGYAQQLMDFAEDFAKNHNYTSIRLDAYSQNKAAIEFYSKRAYFIRGEVYFPGRDLPFFCMEKSFC